MSVKQIAMAAAGAAADSVFVEDVFSTFLYTGNGSTQTITNGIDLSTKGGLVWSKDRGQANNNVLQDTTRGVASVLSSNFTNGDLGYTDNVTTFSPTGYSVGGGSEVNRSTGPYVSWTFRKQPKFFDVVTYTGTGSGPSSVSHNLGSTPGFVIIKSTSRAGNWVTIARQSNGTYALFTDSTGGLQSTAAAYNTSATPGAALTATTFDPSWFNNSATPGAVQNICDNGVTYVAYLFAHDAGGFGLSGTDNVISCGSYTGNGSTTGPTVPLGYEPQWLLIKKATASGSDRNWWLADSMRGMPVGTGDNFLFPNSSGAESAGWDFVSPSATGFQITTTDDNFNTSGITYIYIAIRRGPMRVPTSGTSVFGLSANSNNIDASTSVVMTPEASDLWFNTQRAGTTGKFWLPRLTGWANLNSTSAAVEDTSYTWTQRTQTDLRPNTGWWTGNPSQINYFLRRAPGFFDVVCYTGDGVVGRGVSHNLKVAPELIIAKRRSGTNGSYGTVNDEWNVGVVSPSPYMDLQLCSDQAGQTNNYMFNNSSFDPFIGTASVFYTGGSSAAFNNASGNTYVAYLFASCPGVSKVGSYTGTGSTLQINCGFTGGARFVLIKRTDSTGDWYVWDTARGIVAGNDPYLALNSTAAEVTTTDWVDTFSSGFELSNVGGNNVNINTATYIYLAIA